MGWKDFSYWLRGGIIGGAPYLLLSFLLFFICLISANDGDKGVCVFFLIVSPPIAILFFGIGALIIGELIKFRERRK